MEHCVFQFGREYFVQLSGTAMGAPPAPMYATMYFAIHEATLIPKYIQHLLFYRRFIDDGLGIWINHDETAWDSFKLEMNQFGMLRWEFSDLKDSAEFLDVQLKITGTSITTRIHEKLLNLYLYLPPHSAHPPGVLKSIIFGRIQQINFLCSEQADRTHYTRLLAQRLLARGWSQDILTPIFTAAFSAIKTEIKERDIDTKTSTNLFLHVHYHPTNPPSSNIQNIFYNTLVRGTDGFSCRSIRNHLGNVFSSERLVVAYHRPQNLGNRFSNRRIQFQRGVNGQLHFDDR